MLRRPHAGTLLSCVAPRFWWSWRSPFVLSRLRLELVRVPGESAHDRALLLPGPVTVRAHAARPKAGSQTANAVQGLERKLPLLRIRPGGSARPSAAARDQLPARHPAPCSAIRSAFGDTGASLSGFGQQVPGRLGDARRRQAERAGRRAPRTPGGWNAGTARSSTEPRVWRWRSPDLRCCSARTQAAGDRRARPSRPQPGDRFGAVRGPQSQASIQNATMDVFGSLTSALSTPSAAKARRIAHGSAALRSYVVSVSATASGLTLKFRLNTDASSLAPAQLPIAGGSSSPSLVSGLADSGRHSRPGADRQLRRSRGAVLLAAELRQVPQGAGDDPTQDRSGCQPARRSAER